MATPTAQRLPMIEEAKRALLGLFKTNGKNAAAGSSASYSSKYGILVVDKRATRVLGACLKMQDVTENNFVLVESLEKKRKGFPDLEAVYFCAPTKENIQHLINDFADTTNPRYAKANIYFLYRCPDDVFAMLKSSASLVAKISTLLEVNMNYLAIEEKMFHLDLEDSFVKIFEKNGLRSSGCLDDVVEYLVNFCATMNEYPFVRYDESTEVSARLAAKFQPRMNSFIETDPNFWWYGDGIDGRNDASDRGTLFIFERSHDAAAPLLHNFTYQAMIYDVLNVRDNVCRYFRGDMSDYKGQDDDPDLHLQPLPDKDSEIGVALLKEDDKLWKEFRLLHITKVIEKLNAYIKKFSGSPVGKFLQKGGNASFEDMNRAVQMLPEYKEMIEKHTQHTKLAQLCMKKLQDEQLLRCANLEQLLVTGVNPEAKAPQANFADTEVLQLVQDPSIGEYPTIRILALYLATQPKVTIQDCEALFDKAKPTLPKELKACFQGLSYLGYETNLLDRDSIDYHEKIAEAKRKAQTSEDQFGRYQPKIAAYTEQICKNTLSQNEFPYIIPPPFETLTDSSSANQEQGQKGSQSIFSSGLALGIVKTDRKKDILSSENNDPAGGLSVRSRRKPSIKPNNVTVSTKKGGNIRAAVPDLGPRIIIFIAGGVTMGEARAIHALANMYKKNIVLGSTHILTPKTYIRDLGFLCSSPNVNNEEKQRKSNPGSSERQRKSTIFPVSLSGLKQDGNEPERRTAKIRKSIFGCFGCS